jgi:hypothetical protein
MLTGVCADDCIGRDYWHCQYFSLLIQIHDLTIFRDSFSVLEKQSRKEVLSALCKCFLGPKHKRRLTHIQTAWAIPLSAFSYQESYCPSRSSRTYSLPCGIFVAKRGSALVPLSGAIIRHAEYFVDPALSFANGWNGVYGNMVSLPAELTAAAVIVEFWNQTSSAIWITIFGLLLVASNLFFVRVYGELEFTFVSLKIMLIIGLNIMVSIEVASQEKMRWN